MFKPPRSVLAEAERLWHLDIVDSRKSPASIREIRRMITDPATGIGWTWAQYEDDGDYSWCAAYAGSCWRKAGLHPRLAQTFFSSTYRLDLFGRYKTFGEWFLRRPVLSVPLPGLLGDISGYIRDVHEALGGVREWHDVSGCEFVEGFLDRGYTPRAGDIGLINPSPAKPYGSHAVLIAENFAQGDAGSDRISTIEGNATGFGPDGSRREGVVRNERLVSRFARIVRPAPLDCCSGAQFLMQIERDAALVVGG